MLYCDLRVCRLYEFKDIIDSEVIDIEKLRKVTFRGWWAGLSGLSFKDKYQEVAACTAATVYSLHIEQISGDVQFRL